MRMPRLSEVTGAGAKAAKAPALIFDPGRIVSNITRAPLEGPSRSHSCAGCVQGAGGVGHLLCATARRVKALGVPAGADLTFPSFDCIQCPCPCYIDFAKSPQIA